MICPHCKTDAPDGAKYCPRCQNLIKRNCNCADEPVAGDTALVMEQSSETTLESVGLDKCIQMLESILQRDDFSDIQQKSSCDPLYLLVHSYWKLKIKATFMHCFPRRYRCLFPNHIFSAHDDQGLACRCDRIGAAFLAVNNSPYANAVQCLVRLWKESVLQFPKLSNEYWENGCLRNGIDFLTRDAPRDNSYRVTILGHGMNNVYHGFLGKIPYHWAKIDVWADGIFAGTLGHNSRLDLVFDKNPVEIRMCVAAHDPSGCFTSILQNLEPRCCFQILPSWGWRREKRLRLLKMPNFCCLYEP